MPELPEAETIVRRLRRHLTGRWITSVWVGRRDILHGDWPADADPLAGHRVRGVDREGKRVCLRLSGPLRGGSIDARLVFALGMTGQVTVVRSRTPVLPHTHLRVGLSGGDRELRFRDPRRFGRVWLLTPCGGAATNGELGSRKLALPRSAFPVPRSCRGAPGRTPRPAGAGPGELGPDAMTITWHSFGGLLACRRQIKALLLDQRRISGLGNIYTDEALYRAGIHPRTPACRLSEERGRLLLRGIRLVLRRAIVAGGSTVRDYRDADGEPGWFQVRLQVYGRAGQPCRRCGAVLRRLIVAGRGTTICPRCQKQR